MTCEALINKFLIDYHAGNLPLARKLEFELHLRLCGDCRKYVDSYRKTVAMAKTTSNPDTPAPDDLVRAILRITQKNGE